MSAYEQKGEEQAIDAVLIAEIGQEIAEWRKSKEYQLLSKDCRDRCEKRMR